VPRTSRLLAFAIAIIVCFADAVAIIALTAYGQTLADTAGSPAAPWWLGPAWDIAFFPARYVLLLPPFNHPLGLGGPSDDVVWLSLTMVNGLLWGASTYIILRWRSRREVAA